MLLSCRTKPAFACAESINESSQEAGCTTFQLKLHTSGNGITPVAFRTVLRHPTRIVNLTFVPLLVVRNKLIRLESFLARLQGLKKIASVSNGGNHNFLQSTVGNVNVPPVLEDKAQQW